MFSAVGFAQVNDSIPEIERTVTVDDDKYREDQFYFGITHSILLDTPVGYKPNSFSTGVSFGFLRDFPINERRNVAIAPGFGFKFYNLRNNLSISEDGQEYYVDSGYDKNVQNFTYFEVPLEFRWRTSTKYTHKFWRVYVGLKYSLLIRDVSKYEGVFGNYEVRSNRDYNKSLFGAYVSAGFNTWNFYAYYGFNSIYKKGIFEDGKNLNFLNLGLMFYIL